MTECGDGGMSYVDDWGWRVSLGMTVVPGLFLLVGSLTISDSPNSLAYRGRFDQGKQVRPFLKPAQHEMRSANETWQENIQTTMAESCQAVFHTFTVYTLLAEHAGKNFGLKGQHLTFLSRI